MNSQKMHKKLENDKMCAIYLTRSQGARHQTTIDCSGVIKCLGQISQLPTLKHLLSPNRVFELLWLNFGSMVRSNRLFSDCFGST